MSDQDFRDYFEDNASWVDDRGDEHDHPAESAGTEPPRPPQSRRDRRERRRRKRNRRIVAIIVAIVVVALVFAGLFVGTKKIANWAASRSAESSSVVDDYQGAGTGDVKFSIQSGESVQEIAQGLVDAGIVKSVDAFTSAVSANNLTLYPGTYDMKYQMKASAAAAILSDQGNAQGFLEVKPGERVSTVIQNAADVSGIALSDFQSVVDGGGSGILPSEANGSFEGWLEPGSYDVANETSASAILKELVDARVKKLDDLGVATADREKILIMASIAEAEVNSTEYYGKVVRVILNRLADGMTLGMDTTVAYGLGITADQLTNDQLADASNPYNTRVNTGLPPTPISNPGDSAIEAAINPPEGNWLYFVTVNLKTGETKFTDSDAEFQEYVQEYKTNNPDAN
ncbi:endolytic transglycosylase MltG [Bifidobacterium choloepi]|uniref:Endolytic murein transglycosylase n=1 Tax=Bifidobacterium choloepi TaxID=2614131 RepID=A0A6I5NFX8_9BIFI|nr:endolytic transglycosylase MltG [Bifidobacterium choloepi]